MCWVEHPHPWLLEKDLIDPLDLPLNLDQIRHHAFHKTLSSVRSEQTARARKLDIVLR